MYTVHCAEFKKCTNKLYTDRIPVTCTPYTYFTPRNENFEQNATVRA